MLNVLLAEPNFLLCIYLSDLSEWLRRKTWMSSIGEFQQNPMKMMRISSSDVLSNTGKVFSLQKNGELAKHHWKKLFELFEQR